MTIWAVVPTCRGFLIPEQTVPVKWIIVHDRHAYPILGVQAPHHSIVAPDPELYGQGSDCIRSAGFAYAYQHGEPGDVILTVDDDCRLPSDWAEQHVAVLQSEVPAWQYTVPGLATRGTSAERLRVAISHGLWDGVPDVYAKDQDGRRWRMPVEPHPIAPPFAQSSMNLGFRLEVTPVLYQPAQGIGYEYDRFADIWGGVLAQRCLVGRWGFVNGAAVVYHERASNRDVNLTKEAPGLEVHDAFWRHVWAYRPGWHHGNLFETYRDMARHVRLLGGVYFRGLADRMERWLMALHRH